MTAVIGPVLFGGPAALDGPVVLRDRAALGAGSVARMGDPALPPPMATPRIAAGALFTDEAGRVLLVEPTYKPGWDIPGGYVEPGESPYDACRREVAEEIGVRPPIGALLLVDWAPEPAEGDKMIFVFDGGVLAAADHQAVQPDGREIARAAFHDLDALPSLMPPRLADRVAAALVARADGLGRYAERGRRVP